MIQYPTNRNQAQSHQENAITVLGPRLYNSLSKYLRDIESVKTEKVKYELDKFLELSPDEPKMPIYVPASGSSSILDQLTHLRAQGIYRSGVPDSATEQSSLLRNHSKYPSSKVFRSNHGCKLNAQFLRQNAITVFGLTNGRIARITKFSFEKSIVITKDTKFG